MLPQKRPSIVSPVVDIQLDSTRRTYTTGDSIRGTVEVTTATDLELSDLEILFLGTSRSYIERITPVARAAAANDAFHMFLRLYQPDTNVDLPRDLKAGQTYAFPFCFVVPERLPSHACKHAVVDELVPEAHSQLPPTFGDNDLSRQMDLPDDLSPNNASVKYGVYARLLQEDKQHDEDKSLVLATKARRVRIVPSSISLAPTLEAAEEPGLRREVVIRNKRFAKTGSMVLESQSPQSFRLQSPHASLRRESISTKANIVLRFDPVDEDSKPPQLGKLIILLKTDTFFASAKREHLPTKQHVDDDPTQAVHCHQTVLSRRCMSVVEWAKRHPLEPYNHPVPDPSKAYKKGVFYLAQIMVPIALPPDVTMVPAFHSCLLSRVYGLNMRLTIRNGGVWSRALQLDFPIQVALERERRRPTYTEAMLQAGIAGGIEEDEAADEDLCSGRRRRSQRQDSVLGYGHFGVRLDELPAYTR